MKIQSRIDGAGLPTVARSQAEQSLIQSFIDYLDVKPRTVRNYKQGVSKLLFFFDGAGFGGASHWGAHNPKVLRQAFIDFRAELENTYTPSTARLYITAARLFIGWLALEGVCSNFAVRVKAVTVSQGHKRDPISEPQAQQLLVALKGDSLIDKRNLAIAALMLSTGVRCIEVSRADVGDMHISGGRWFLRVHGKKRSGKDEVVQLPAPVKALIDEYLAARGSVGNDCNLFERYELQPLFAATSYNNKGGRLSTVTISGIIKRGLKSIGIDSRRITAHSLRHTFVTQALLKGASDKDVQQACRHKSVNVLAEYRHDIDRLSNTVEETVAAGLFAGLTGL